MSKQYHNTHSHPGLTIFCLIMTLIILAGCTLGGLQLWAPDGKNLKPSEWFQKDEETEPAPEDPAEETPVPENGGLMLPETAEGNGIALMSTVIPVAQYGEYGVMPIAESAQTITATIQPEEASPFARITWTAAWKGGNGGGKDVSEYLTLSFGEDIDSSKRCTVSCLKTFTTQIVITASVVDQPEISTSVTADYIRTYQSFEFTFHGDQYSNKDYIFGAEQPVYGISFTFTAGTKYPDLENPESHHLYIKLDGTFKNLLSKNIAGNSDITYTDKAMLHTDWKNYGDNFANCFIDEMQFGFYPNNNFESPAAAFLTGDSASNPDHIKKFNSAFAATINEANSSPNKASYHALLTTDDTINFSFNGKSYGSASDAAYQFKFSMDGLKILADSISPSSESIYF